MTTALLVIGILVLLIVAHEFGHFLAAKIFGVRVQEFGVGFPPRAFTFGSWGGTEYTLNWIPFGGFVKLFGEEEGTDHGKGSFIDAPRWKQALILVAGVTANMVIAWMLFTAAYSFGILHVVDDESLPGGRLLVTDVVLGSPADVGGIKPGDEVLSVEDSEGLTAALTPAGIMSFVSERGGEDITIEYVHGAATSSAVVRPAHAVIAESAGRPAIGLGLAIVTSEALPFKESLRAAAISTYNTLRLSFDGLWDIIKSALRGAPNLQNVTGPIGIIGAVGEASQNGWGYVLSLAAFISVNLAIINLIPIPALDGGRLVIVGIEALMRRDAPKLAMQVLNALGIALIIILMITVTYQDILRLL
ncbi:MAG: M50 family metallopeptidase [Minisyncoccota bacterium]